jgi:lipopolysaccharide/colanic/teichoic acid biosynthesis glycosyltransferase
VWASASASLLLIMLLPLLLLLALGTWLASGRVWERAACARPGSGTPEPFDLLHFATRNRNGRVTWLGALLQKLEWQRLPELWNVARGDLLLIGVKPLTPDEIRQITEPWQQKRNEYPAGFTGLWFTQLGPHSNLDEILVSDAYYVATRSWRGDFKLLWQTPKAWWARRQSGQTTQTQLATAKQG